MNLSQDAARWEVLFQARVACVADVITWADEQIAAMDKPHRTLIEISTARVNAFYDVPAYLRELGQSVDRFDALRFALPALRRAIETGRIRPESAAGFAYRYLASTSLGLPEDLRPLYSADDEFDLAIEEAYGDRSEVERRFLSAMRTAERF